MGAIISGAFFRTPYFRYLNEVLSAYFSIFLAQRHVLLHVYLDRNHNSMRSGNKQCIEDTETQYINAIR